MGRDTPECLLCTAHTSHTTGICSHCRIEQTVDNKALNDGQWTRNGLTLVWTPDPMCHCGELLVGPSCDTCLAWAEKDARLHAERAESWANRGRIWDVLELRRGRRAA